MRTLSLKAATVLALAATVWSARAGELAWGNDLAAALKQAAERQQPVLVDFGADWCRYCKLMDETTLRDPAVRRLLERVVRVKVDLDRQPQVAAKYGVHSLPTFLLLDAGGQVTARLVGYQQTEAMRAWLETPRDVRPSQPAAAIGKAWKDLPPDQQKTWIPELVATVAAADEQTDVREEEVFLAAQAKADPGAFVGYLLDERLAYRILGANLLADRLTGDVAYDAWAASADREAAVARLKTTLPAR